MDKKIEKLKERQDELFATIAEMLSSISSPVRIKLIHFLSQGPLSVDVLATKIDQSMANTSMHLRKMLAAKIVTSTTQGKNRIYTLHPAMLIFWESCQDFVQQVNPAFILEIEDIYEDINWKENLKTTIKMLKNNKLVLLDARPKDEASEAFQESNILNIPSSDLEKNFSKIPKKKPVLVFCRGRLCALSAFAVNELRKKGIKAYRLNESWYSLKSML